MTQPPSGTVTFLFTDIEGSTERWDRHPAAMRAALERHDALLRAAVERQGGFVFKTVGDAFCVAFRDPRAGLAAAVDAQRAVTSEEWTRFGDGFPPIKVRMGLHTGEAAEREGDYFGPPVNRCARIEAAANGAQLLVSAVSRALLETLEPLPGLRFRDLGEHRLRDLGQAERIAQVVIVGLPDDTRALRSAGAIGAEDRVMVVDWRETGADPSPNSGATVLNRTVPETFEALSQVLRGDQGQVVLTKEQVLAAARHKPASQREYRLGRVAEWSQPRYRLDKRFVGLTLLLDQGEQAPQGRWEEAAERGGDLQALLAALPDPALVLLGPPGSGKSTLLRRLELDLAVDALRAGDPDRAPLTFFIGLNQYAADPGKPPPPPDRWLADRWAARNPELPPFKDLLGQGRLILLLDALNEMPATGEQDLHARVQLWKIWLQRLAAERPGNRVIFSCRGLDYSQPLSTPDLRVPQVRIEPLADRQVRDFLVQNCPARWREVWQTVEGSPQLELLRSPYFLSLLVEQVEATGAMPVGRAALFTGFVRQALRREVERGHPLFEPGALVDARDRRRLTSGVWRSSWDLPERGPLLPKLADLAFGMQRGRADGGASQVRIRYDDALALLDCDDDERIVAAGEALAVLDEDEAADTLLYVHQLLQEYFAARRLAAAPGLAADLARGAWREAEIQPSLAALLDSLDPADPLPPLPQTGWEETALLAAAMAAPPDAFVAGLLEANLVLAGRCAMQDDVRDRLPRAMLDRLRWALVDRSRDPGADLRERIAAGFVWGDLGDPRLSRRVGPHGDYLLPPLVTIPGGAYPIGDDAPIAWSAPGASGTSEAHLPRHAVPIASFQIGVTPVTNAEWACFMAAGGYGDERWWDTDDGRRWQRGELPDEASRANNRDWRRRFREQPGAFERLVAEGRMGSEEAVERWRGWIAIDDDAFEAILATRSRYHQEVEPAYWRDSRHNRRAQPVVGVSWYEARAYCRWLAAQSGLAFRLPTEVEWEAAARGLAGRRFAWGDAFDRLWANTSEARLRQASPVGVFPSGDTPEGLVDITGNVDEWTSSLWAGEHPYEPAFGYPYDPDDGREDPAAAARERRIVRGGSSLFDRSLALAVYRDGTYPDARPDAVGFRLARSPVPSPRHQNRSG